MLMLLGIGVVAARLARVDLNHPWFLIGLPILTSALVVIGLIASLKLVRARKRATTGC
jgi:hypothetical protein